MNTDLDELRRLYRARDHGELRVGPACQAMVLTRPRRRGGEGGMK
ncbi:MAG TPA: hypothetical protein VFL93_13800 [Longimicrobiaceae bacterium]|nr:hypothetical protein [Longimicrobiaceae bacterium]